MKVLLAIDGSKCSQAATSALMAQLAPQHSEVHVLHADEWPKDLPPYWTFAEGPTAAKDILELHEMWRREAESLVAHAAAQLRSAGFQTTTTIRNGEAQRTILDCASEWHADLIVLGSHGRHGLDRWLLGSVSDGVARHAPCSVEIVRESSDR